jgi:hypothetical protein
MKKILILSSIAMLGVLSAMGQGTVNLNPSSTIGVFVTIQETNGVINSGTAVKIGTPATAAGFAGAGAGQVTIDIYGAVNGTSVAAAEATTPLFSVLNASSGIATAQGTFNASAAFAATTANITGWNGSSALEFIVTGAATVNGTAAYFGSAEATGVLAATGANPPTAIFGTGAGQISSFVIDPPSTPEPSTIALGGLGVAALLAFRRRK